MRLRSKRGDPEPPIWAATWIARVTVVTAPERLFGSRPGGKQALARLASLPWAGRASIAAARRCHAAAQIAHRGTIMRC